MKRFPDGVESKFFFEKHIPSHAPDWVRSVDVPASEGGEVIPYAMVDDLPTLAWAANLGAIELHVPLWHVGRRRKLPARPDFMVFDLDPGEGTSIVECCEVAGYVTEELARQGTESFAKTSGSKGLQLYAAAGPKATWDSVRDRSHDIARKLETDHRELVVSNMRKSLRRGRVLIDWSQNHPAKTTVAVYSVRAMPTPTASTPVSPAEVFCAVFCGGARNPHKRGKGCGGRRSGASNRIHLGGQRNIGVDGTRSSAQFAVTKRPARSSIRSRRDAQMTHSGDRSPARTIVQKRRCAHRK
jgi:DNA ligase D-like protein (predicted polymerase)